MSFMKFQVKKSKVSGWEFAETNSNYTKIYFPRQDYAVYFATLYCNLLDGEFTIVGNNFSEVDE